MFRECRLGSRAGEQKRLLVPAAIIWESSLSQVDSHKLLALNMVSRVCFTAQEATGAEFPPRVVWVRRETVDEIDRGTAARLGLRVVGSGFASIKTSLD